LESRVVQELNDNKNIEKRSEVKRREVKKRGEEGRVFEEQGVNDTLSGKPSLHKFDFSVLDFF
jgi:hypothetical protein